MPMNNVCRKTALAGPLGKWSRNKLGESFAIGETRNCPGSERAEGGSGLSIVAGRRQGARKWPGFGGKRRCGRWCVFVGPRADRHGAGGV